MFEQLKPGDTYQRNIQAPVEVVNFDPTKVSVFLMYMTGGCYIVANPPDATEPFGLNYTERTNYDKYVLVREYRPDKDKDGLTNWWAERDIEILKQIINENTSIQPINTCLA